MAVSEARKNRIYELQDQVETLEEVLRGIRSTVRVARGHGDIDKCLEVIDRTARAALNPERPGNSAAPWDRDSELYEALEGARNTLENAALGSRSVEDLLALLDARAALNSSGSGDE